MWLYVLFGIALELVSDYTSYSNLDASIGEYPEEEGCYPEEEEEQFENYQGKLIFLQVQSPTKDKALSSFLINHEPIPSFTTSFICKLYCFGLSKYFLIHDSMGLMLD